MLVPRTQVRTTNAILPSIKKNVSKTAEKLSKICFDVRSNKLITEPYQDIFKKGYSTSGGGDYSGMSVCDPAWGITC